MRNEIVFTFQKIGAKLMNKLQLPPPDCYFMLTRLFLLIRDSSPEKAGALRDRDMRPHGISIYEPGTFSTKNYCGFKA